MVKIRRGGYVFVTWKGDHPPRHVHVYGDAGLILKWDLDEGEVMSGAAPRRVVKLIRRLEQEGRL